MFRKRTALALAAILSFLLAAPLARPALADDVEQIEKATRIADEAANTWGSLGAFEKEESLLAAAEKELAGVDETGKAPVVAKIKETRDQIARSKGSWDAGQQKSALERAIGTAEGYGDRLDGEHFEERLKTVETALADGWIKGHLDAAVAADLQKKIDWARKKFASQSNKAESRALTGSLDRTLGQAQESAEAAAKSSGYEDDFKMRIGQAEELLADADNKKALGAEAAKYQKKIADLKALFAKNAIEYQFAQLDKGVQWIQDVLDGKNTHAYTNNVEDQFKAMAEGLDKAPQGDPRTAKIRAKVAEQRKAFDAGQAQGARDETVKPMVDYWKYCNDTYAKEGEGWEAETGPSDLKSFLHHSPASLGCDKTEKLLSEVVQRFYGSDQVKNALAKFPNDPEVKKTDGEAKALLEKAGGKVCDFAAKILDEGEKLPAGRDRESLIERFYNLKVTINNATKGCSKNAAVIARIDGLDKRFGQEKAAGEAAQAELVKKLTDSTNAVWPDMKKAYASKFTNIDPADAIENVGKWKGTVLFFEGGGPGVNLNRSGWSYYDDFEFIVEVRGIPICGDFDGGLLEAIKAVRKQTGNVEPYNCEEVIGIVDGLCKATPRVQNPLNHNDYFRDTPQKAVHMRIVAWKACTVAACVGHGTNLAKHPELKEVSVSETGSTPGGGGGSSSGSSGGAGGGVIHFVHRFVAWGMCLLLALAGALALAHGASKFVPQIQEQKAKLGDYLGYAGAGFAVAGVVWFGAAIVLPLIFADVRFLSLPSVALIFGGAASALDLLRVKGKITPEMAATIQPAGILFGLGCFAAAAAHFLCWDWPLL